MIISEPASNYKTKPDEVLDNRYISVEVGQAVEHLQDVLNRIQAGTLDQSWFKVRFWDSLRHLSRAYNLRCPDSTAYINMSDASKLPIDIVRELGYSGESIDEFVYTSEDNIDDGSLKDQPPL